MARPKKVPNPDAPETNYLLKGVPLDLWRAARAKATKEGTSMKTILVALIRAWVEA